MSHAKIDSFIILFIALFFKFRNWLAIKAVLCIIFSASFFIVFSVVFIFVVLMNDHSFSIIIRHYIILLYTVDFPILLNSLLSYMIKKVYRDDLI